MGWTNPRRHAIHHQAPNPLPVKNSNSCHCSYPFELSYFTLLRRLLHKYKSQELYFSYWPVSKRTEARHHALHCNISLWLPVCIDDSAACCNPNRGHDGAHLQVTALLFQWGRCCQAQKPVRFCTGCSQADLMQSQGMTVPQELGGSGQCQLGLQSYMSTGMELASLHHLLATSTSHSMQIPAGGNHGCACKPVTHVFCCCFSATK